MPLDTITGGGLADSQRQTNQSCLKSLHDYKNRNSRVIISLLYTQHVKPKLRHKVLMHLPNLKNQMKGLTNYTWLRPQGPILENSLGRDAYGKDAHPPPPFSLSINMKREVKQLIHLWIQGKEIYLQRVKHSSCDIQLYDFVVTAANTAAACC